MKKSYEQVGKEIGKFTDKKNVIYGDSFAKCNIYLELLYPDGVPVEKYKDMLGLVRDFDKNMRIATKKDALGENPWKDKAGYAILMVGQDENDFEETVQETKY